MARVGLAGPVVAALVLSTMAVFWGFGQFALGVSSAPVVRWLLAGTAVLGWLLVPEQGQGRPFAQLVWHGAAWVTVPLPFLVLLGLLPGADPAWHIAVGLGAVSVCVMCAALLSRLSAVAPRWTLAWLAAGITAWSAAIL